MGSRRGPVVAVALLVVVLLSWPQNVFVAWRYWPCQMVGVLCVPYRSSGRDGGMTRLREAFDRNFATMRETRRASVAVAVGGRVVVSLHGARGGVGDALDEGALQIAFSTSKVVASIAMAVLADRGRLAYDAPVARYWPEFAANGKGNFTLRDVMQHAAGLAWLCDGDDATDDGLALWDVRVPDDEYLNRSAATIARSRPNFPPNTRTAYHGITRDMILSEVVRRVEGHTLGDFVEKHIAHPLGAEFYWGINASLHKRVVPMLGDSLGWALLYAARVLGLYAMGALPEAPQNLTAIVAELLRGALGGGTPIAMRISNGLSPFAFVDTHNTLFLQSRESPSSNGITNAQSLAAIGTLLAGPTPLLSEKGRRAALEVAAEPQYDGITHAWGRFTACGVMCWDASWDLLHGWCGWHGIGGQLFLFDPKRNIVFAYLTTGFGVLPPWRDPRTRTLLEALAADLVAGGE